MYNERMKDKKGTETPYAHNSKLLYCQYKLEHLKETTSISKFLKWLNQKIENDEIFIEKMPKESTIANNWRDRWKWDECADAYIDEYVLKKIGKAILIYDYDILEDIISDSKAKARYQKRREDILNGKILFDNPTNKDQSLSHIENSLDKIERRDRLKLDKTTENNKNNVEMEHKGLKRLADAFK